MKQLLKSKKIFLILSLTFTGISTNPNLFEIIAQTQDELSESLLSAAKNGQIELIKELIFNGIDVNARNKYSETALMIASANGQIEAVKVLLSNKADVNAKSKSMETALISASSKGHADIVQTLLDNGAEIDFKDRFERSALIRATQEGHVETLETLLKNNANVDLKMGEQTALIWAIDKDFVKCVDVLIKYNANINVKMETGITALDIARKKKNNKIINLLLKYGAKEGVVVDSKDKPAIVISAEYGKTKTVEDLIKNGANVNVKSRYNWTALAMAAKEGHLDIVKLLIDNGADVNLIDSYNYRQTPLVYAVKEGHVQIAKILLENGANPNITPSEELGGYTPLINAVRHSNLEMVKVLINNGADINKKHYYKGETALDFAKAYGDKRIINILSKAEAQFFRSVKSNEAKIKSMGGSFYAWGELKDETNTKSRTFSNIIELHVHEGEPNKYAVIDVSGKGIKVADGKFGNIVYTGMTAETWVGYRNGEYPDAGFYALLAVGTKIKLPSHWVHIFGVRCKDGTMYILTDGIKLSSDTTIEKK